MLSIQKPEYYISLIDVTHNCIKHNTDIKMRFVLQFCLMLNVIIQIKTQISAWFPLCGQNQQAAVAMQAQAFSYCWHQIPDPRSNSDASRVSVALRAHLRLWQDTIFQDIEAVALAGSRQPTSSFCSVRNITRKVSR